jgi:hypothetical protein
MAAQRPMSLQERGASATPYGLTAAGPDVASSYAASVFSREAQSHARQVQREHTAALRTIDRKMQSMTLGHMAGLSGVSLSAMATPMAAAPNPFADMEARGGAMGSADEKNQLQFRRFGAVARQWHRRMTAMQSVSGMGELAGGAIGGKAGAEAGAGIGTIIQALIDTTSRTFNTFGNMKNTFSNASLSDTQKAQISREHLPIVGNLLKSMREFGQAMDGTTETLRANRDRFANLGLEQSTHYSAEAEKSAFRGRLSEAQNRFAGIGGASAAPQQLFDRSTSQGQAAYQQAQRLLPLQDAAAAAAREVQVARANEQAAIGRRDVGARTLRSAGNRHAAYGAAVANLDRQNRRYAHAWFFETNPLSRAGAGAFGSPDLGGLHDPTGELDTARRSLAQASQDMATAANEQRTRNQAVEAAGTARIQAEQRQHGAMIDLNRGRLGNLQQAESHMSSQAGRFGAMGRNQRIQALSAARQIRQRGIANVPHSLIELARQFDPNFVESEAQRAGENTPEYRAWQQDFAPRNERGSLGDVRNDITTMQDQIRGQVLDAATMAAKSQVALVTAVLAKFQEYLDKAVHSVIGHQHELQAAEHGRQMH